jgi:uncharacterized protein YaaQ
MVSTSGSPQSVQHVLVIMVNGLQAEKLMKRLSAARIYFTQIDSSGGVLQEPTLCLLVGLDSSRLPDVSAILEECCQPYRQYIPTQMTLPADYTQVPMIEAQMGGATVYSMNVERFIQL